MSTPGGSPVEAVDGDSSEADIEKVQDSQSTESIQNQTPPTLAEDQPRINHTDQSFDSPRPYGNGGLPAITPNMAELGVIPTAPKNMVGNPRTLPTRDGGKMKHPNQMVKISTVSVTNRTRDSNRTSYSNYVENRKPRKVVTWDEATTARPPLRIDMEGPTACSYSPKNKPLHETNAPSWSFGRKTFVEKSGGARTSWEKTWFQNPDVWTQKADFFSDRRWPAPPTHTQKQTLGARLASLHASPQHTFGYRREFTIVKKEPGPNEYNIGKANAVVLPKSPAFSHSFRRGGTSLWGYTETTPGPGTYKPERSYTRMKLHQPSFSIRGIRREKSHELGPFAAF